MELLKIKITKQNRNLLTILLFAVILLELAWAWGVLAKPTPVTPTPEVVTVPEAALALSPAEGTFAADKNFAVQIILKAEDTVTTDGLDVLVTFDPQKLEVLDVSSTDFYPQRLLNTVDNEQGVLRLALTNTPDREEIKGGGAIATITLKPLQAGEAQVIFGDSLVADRAGLNILGQTNGGNYVIE